MAWFSMHVKNRLKRTGASTHPCLTPLEMLKGSDASPSESTCTVMSLWNWRIRFTNLVGYPSLDRITQRASVDCVKGFRQVYEDGSEVHILFDALLHLAYREDHVGGTAVWSESTLGFRQAVLRGVGDEVVEDDPSQDLPSDGQERDAPVVAAVSLTAPVLEQGQMYS